MAAAAKSSSITFYVTNEEKTRFRDLVATWKRTKSCRSSTDALILLLDLYEEEVSDREPICRPLVGKGTNLFIPLSDVDKTRFNNLLEHGKQSRSMKSNRDMLVFLMNVQGQQASQQTETSQRRMDTNTQQAEGDDSDEESRQVLDVEPMQSSVKRRIVFSTDDRSAPKRGAGDHAESQPEDTQARMPIYARATSALNLQFAIGSDDPYEYNEVDDEVNRDVSPVQRQQQETYEPQMLDISTRVQGLLSKSAKATCPTEGDVRRLEKAAEVRKMAHILYDFADSPRLLPGDYYKQFSANKQCRLHVSETPDTDAFGVALPAMSRRQRRKEMRTMDALEVATSQRYIVDLKLLGQLISPKCYRLDCTDLNDFDSLEVKRDGAALIISVRCKGPLRHEKVWFSSPRLQHFHNNKSIYFAINTLLPAAILTSGNQFKKINMLLDALNVAGISEHHYLDTQRFVLAPVVGEWWNQTQEMIGESLKQQQMTVVIAGDGQFDSPGHCATYCTYTNMIIGTYQDSPSSAENSSVDNRVYRPTAYIASVDVIEKRHTNLNSPNMEVAGFFRSVLSLIGADISAVEIVTDAQTTIEAIMEAAKHNPDAFNSYYTSMLQNMEEGADADLMDACRFYLEATEHQKDVWHFTKNLGAELETKKHLGRGQRPNYQKWIRSLKNHFWFCAKTCNGDVRIMKNNWMEVIHHIKDEHEWPGGRCNHEFDAPRKPDDPEFLHPKSPAYKAIRQTVAKKAFLENFRYYTKFRHTGLLESFHQMTLAYANKRTFYGFAALTIRKLLAALDFNHHTHLPVQTAADGSPKMGKKYYPRLGDWAIRFVKEEKQYEYVKHLMACYLYERGITEGRFHGRGKKSVDDEGAATTRPYLVLPNDPRLLQPNVARVQTTLAEVIAKRWSRFGPAYAAPRVAGPEENSEEELDEELDTSEESSEDSSSDDESEAASPESDSSDTDMW